MSHSWKKQGGRLKQMNLVKTNQLVATKNHHFHKYNVPSAVDNSGIVITGDTVTFESGANVIIIGNNADNTITFHNTAGYMAGDAVWQAGTDTSKYAIEASNNTLTQAIGMYAVAAGSNTTAEGIASFSDGSGTHAFGNSSVAFGVDCSAIGIASFADGSGSIAVTDYSIALGHGGTTGASNSGGLMNSLVLAVGVSGENVMELDVSGNLWLKRTGLVHQSRMWQPGKDKLAPNDPTKDPSGALVADNFNETGLTASAAYAIATGDNTDAEGIASFTGGKDTVAEGNYSVAMGLRSNAKNTGSFAMGRDTITEGELSFSMGDSTTASGYASVAIGSGTDASGDFSIAMGWGGKSLGIASTTMGEGTWAIGDYSTAMGRNTKARGYVSTAIGCLCEASGNAAIAMGEDTRAYGDISTAMGGKSRAIGKYSTAMGYDCSAIGIASFADGSACVTRGESAVAMGSECEASGNYSAAFGHKTLASNESAIAMGDSTTASGQSSVAFGHNTKASGEVSLAMGFSGEAIGKYSVVMGENCVTSGQSSLIAGNNNVITSSGKYAVVFGHDCSGAGEACYVDGSGCYGGGKWSFATGVGCKTSGNASISMGRDCIASGIGSFAHGLRCESAGNYSISFGEDTKVTSTGENSIVMGISGEIHGKFSVGIGNKVSVIEGVLGGVAMGENTRVEGNYAVAMGKDTVASGAYSVAMGYNTSTGADYSVAMGKDSSTNAIGAIVMGENCYASEKYSVVIGQGGTTATSSDFQEKFSSLTGTIVFAIGAGPLTTANFGIGNILELNSTGELWVKSIGKIERTTTASSSTPIGCIIPLAGVATIPTGWIICGGQAISKSDFPELFQVVGLTYGAGDPDGTTFNVPDLRGRAPWGYCPEGSIVQPGSTAGGLINYPETGDSSGGVPSWYEENTGPAASSNTLKPYIWPQIPCPFAGSLDIGDASGSSAPPLIPEHRHHISQEPHTHKFQPPDPNSSGTFNSDNTYTAVAEAGISPETTTNAAIANIGNVVTNPTGDDVLDACGNIVYDGMTEYFGVPQTNPPLSATDNLPPCIAFIYVIKAI